MQDAKDISQCILMHPKRNIVGGYSEVGSKSNLFGAMREELKIIEHF